MKMIPIHPDDLEAYLAAGDESDSSGIRQTAGSTATRRTLGWRVPTRRTLGRRVPTRRTLGRRVPTRRAL